MIIIICIVAGVLCLTILISISNRKKRQKESIMSFRESMDLTELPIVTFTNNNKKLNFLLDTGSNMSYINQSVLKDIEYEKNNGYKTDMIGIEGNKIESESCNIKVCYKEYIFDSEFSILDMDHTFNIIKKESGVQLHGILGNKFFQTYKYVLDFESLTAYMK